MSNSTIEKKSKLAVTKGYLNLALNEMEAAFECDINFKVIRSSVKLAINMIDEVYAIINYNELREEISDE